jgi:hypothetical protein
VAITIRNKTTEELIRKIGRRTGEGPSAVVRRLVEREAVGQDATVPEDEVQRRIAEFEALASQYPPPDPKPSWAEIQHDMDALYDYMDSEHGNDARAAKRS